MTLKRKASLLFALALVAVGFAALPYLDALGFIIRAADLPGTPATVAAWRANSFTRDPEITVPTRGGDIPARFFRPARQTRRTLVLIPGVHRDGINESRLVGLAEDLAATGYGVLTVAAPDLQRFKITPAVTDTIEDAVRWTSEQPQFRTDGKIGIVGISFSGGLSIVAAGRDSIKDRVAFVMSFGGHGDLSRAMHYLTTGEVLGDLEKAKRSSAVLGRRSRRRASPARLRARRHAPQSRRSRCARGSGRSVVERHRRIPARVLARGHRSAEGDPGLRGDEEHTRRRFPSHRAPTCNT